MTQQELNQLQRNHAELTRDERICAVLSLLVDSIPVYNNDRTYALMQLARQLLAEIKQDSRQKATRNGAGTGTGTMAAAVAVEPVVDRPTQSI
jgi:hypothetical protein